MGENREQQQAGKASVTRAQEDLEVGQRRIRRHEMHRSQTYAAFIKQLCERGGMSPGVAEKAATSVLCAIEQRIMPDESRNMEAQLPRKLTELLHRCERHEDEKPRKFGRDELLRMVGEDLDLEPDAVVPVVRAVCDVVRSRLSEGEAEDVMGQLPEELRAFWRPLA